MNNEVKSDVLLSSSASVVWILRRNVQELAFTVNIQKHNRFNRAIKLWTFWSTYYMKTHNSLLMRRALRYCFVSRGQKTKRTGTPERPPIILHRVAGGNLPQLTLGQRRVKPWTARRFIEGLTDTPAGKSDSPVHPTYTSFGVWEDDGRPTEGDWGGWPLPGIEPVCGCTDSATPPRVSSDRSMVVPAASLHLMKFLKIYFTFYVFCLFIYSKPLFKQEDWG